MHLTLNMEHTFIYSLNIVNTYIYIFSKVQHTYKHSYMQPLQGRYNVFLCHAHMHSHLRTLWVARSFLLLGNSSLVHEKSNRCTTLNSPITTYINLATCCVALLPMWKWTPISCVIVEQAKWSTTAATTKQNIWFFKEKKHQGGHK